MDPSQLRDFAHIVLAVILGGMVGFEREAEGKPAGLRTHMIVAGTSALFAIAGFRISVYYHNLAPESLMEGDPTRIIQAIAVGVSFIGAGTIIQSESKATVKNLTTAASILFVAAIGVMSAIGEYFLAIASSILVFGINYAVGIMERAAFDKKPPE